MPTAKHNKIILLLLAVLLSFGILTPFFTSGGQVWAIPETTVTVNGNELEGTLVGPAGVPSIPPGTTPSEDDFTPVTTASEYNTYDATFERLKAEEGAKEVMNQKLGGLASKFGVDISKGDSDLKREASTPFYALAMEDVSNLKIAAHACHAIANGIFSASVWLMTLTTKSVDAAMDFDVYTHLGSGALGIIDKFQSFFSISGTNASTTNGMPGLVWLGIFLGVIGAIFLLAKGSTTEAIGRLLQIVLIVALILGYAALPTKWLEVSCTAVSEIGQSIATGVTKDGDINSVVWKAGVDYPWQTLEFGSVMVDEGMLDANTDNVYRQWWNYDTDSRTESHEGLLPNDIKTYQYLPGTAGAQGARIGLAALVFFIDAVLTIIISVLCLIEIGFQIAMVLMWVIGIFVLVRALFPSGGINKVKEWLGLLAFTYFAQILLYIVIVIMMTFIGFIYNATGGYSFLMSALLVIATIVGFYLMKGPLVQLFGGQASQTIGGIKQAGRRGKNKLQQSGRRIGGHGAPSDTSVFPHPRRQSREAKRAVQRLAKQDKYAQEYRDKQRRKEHPEDNERIRDLAKQSVKTHIKAAKADHDTRKMDNMNAEERATYGAKLKRRQDVKENVVDTVTMRKAKRKAQANHAERMSRVDATKKRKEYLKGQQSRSVTRQQTQLAQAAKTEHDRAAILRAADTGDTTSLDKQGARTVRKLEEHRVKETAPTKPPKVEEVREKRVKVEAKKGKVQKTIEEKTTTKPKG